MSSFFRKKILEIWIADTLLTHVRNAKVCAKTTEKLDNMTKRVRQNHGKNHGKLPTIGKRNESGENVSFPPATSLGKT